MFKVSHSKMKTWRMCRQAYHFKYVDRIQRRRKGRPLMFGSIIHECLDALKEGDDWVDKLEEISKERGKLFQREVEEYGDIIEDARIILTEYEEYWANDDLKWIRFNKKSAEHEFEVEIAKGIILTGKIDAKAKRNGLKWLVEHKTFGKTIPDQDKRWKNVQSATYMRVMQMLGWGEVDGTLWDFVGSKPPSAPKFKQNGELSKARVITLPSKIKMELTRKGLSFKKYKSLLDTAAACRPMYFQRIQNTVKEEVVDILFKDTVAVAQEMEKFHGKVWDMNVDFHCDRCDYNGLCAARLRGLDVDYVREREYEVREKFDKKK